MSGRKTKQNWNRTSSTAWDCKAHRGYTAQIVYVAGTGYTLTITGSGAPAPSTLSTLGLAKNEFSKFLRTK